MPVCRTCKGEKALYEMVESVGAPTICIECSRREREVSRAPRSSAVRAAGAEPWERGERPVNGAGINAARLNELSRYLPPPPEMPIPIPPPPGRSRSGPPATCGLCGRWVRANKGVYGEAGEALHRECWLGPEVTAALKKSASAAGAAVVSRQSERHAADAGGYYRRATSNTCRTPIAVAWSYGTLLAGSGTLLSLRMLEPETAKNALPAASIPVSAPLRVSSGTSRITGIETAGNLEPRGRTAMVRADPARCRRELWQQHEDRLPHT